MEKRKRKGIILSIIDKLRDLLSLHCPECNGRMKSEFWDIETDNLVYKCTKCGKEWF